MARTLHAGSMVGALLLSLTLLTTGAMAHSTNLGTVPADGAELTVVPEQLMISFDEPARLTQVDAVRVSSEGTDNERLDLPQDALIDNAVDLPDLGPGMYTITWRALSADGHVVNGSFSFSVED